MLKKIGDNVFIEMDEVIGIQKGVNPLDPKYGIHIEYKNGSRFVIETNFKSNWNEMFKQICNLIEGDEDNVKKT